MSNFIKKILLEVRNLANSIIQLNYFAKVFQLIKVFIHFDIISQEFKQICFLSFSFYDLHPQLCISINVYEEYFCLL
jgi:hypothetical protein